MYVWHAIGRHNQAWRQNAAALDEAISQLSPAPSSRPGHLWLFARGIVCIKILLIPGALCTNLICTFYVTLLCWTCIDTYILWQRQYHILEDPRLPKKYCCKLISALHHPTAIILLDSVHHFARIQATAFSVSPPALVFAARPTLMPTPLNSCSCVAATPTRTVVSSRTTYWICSKPLKVLPFSLMLFLASSMSHVEAAVVQVAYRNAKYLWPGFAGIYTIYWNIYMYTSYIYYRN